MIPREEILESNKYDDLCNHVFTGGDTSLPPSGIVGVPIEHIDEFFGLCKDSDNEYVIVSQRSDYGLAYQEEHPVWLDMKKWIGGLPFMDGTDVIRFDQIGYSDIKIPARCEPSKCRESDKYSVKCSTHTRITFDSIPKNIKRWFLANCMIEEDGVECLPFGINKDTADILVQTPEQEKTGWVYVNFHTYTLERFFLWKWFYNFMPEWATLIQDVKELPEYFKDISSHRFVICPDGNGVDCFRTWESLYLGAIPIVLSSTTTSYFDDLPILIVDDMQAITMPFLQEQYDRITSQDWNMEKIKLSYWKSKFEECYNESSN